MPPDCICVFRGRQLRPRRVARSPGFVANLQRSQDGRALYFERERALYVVAASGGRPRTVVVRRPRPFGRAVAPDGKRVAFAEGRDLVVADRPPNGLGAVRRLIRAAQPDGLSALDVRASGPIARWSPDGRWLAAAERDAVRARAGVHIRAVAGRGRSLVVELAEKARIMRWSRDGRWVVVELSDRAGFPIAVAAVSARDGRQTEVFRGRSGQRILGLGGAG